MAGETILVVEDEAIIAFNLQRILTGFGYRVPETVSSGKAALRTMDTLLPDLVLMDIQLQGDMDGIEAARRFRAKGDVPIIYLTAYAEDARLAEARQTAPYGYLVKPVQDRELRATIEMALFKHQLDRRLIESERTYHGLYHNTPAMLHTIDKNGYIIQVSDFWLRELGYSREEVIGHDLKEFVAPDSLDYLLGVVLPEFIRTGMIRDVECQFLRKDGQVIYTYISTVAVYDEHHHIDHSHAALVDITARKKAEFAERDQRTLAEALRDTAAALSSTLRLEEVLKRVLANVGRVVPHDAANLMLMDGEYARVDGYEGYAALGMEDATKSMRVKVDEAMHLRTMADSRRPLAIPDTAGYPGWTVDWIRSYAGAPIIIKDRLVGFINLVGITPNFYNQEHASRLQIFADQAAIAIENARLYAEVQRLATLDDVTGIFNRRRLFELGRVELERARRYNTPLAAILLDIDLFKKINDTYGHTTGDRVLAGIAAAISRNIREVDLFGLYGVEEFVVLLPLTDRQAALEVAERLRALITGLHFATDRGPLSVTISLGVAMLSAKMPSLATLVDWADQAMYAAKRAGRNRVEFYE